MYIYIPLHIRTDQRGSGGRGSDGAAWQGGGRSRAGEGGEVMGLSSRVATGHCAGFCTRNVCCASRNQLIMLTRWVQQGRIYRSRIVEDRIET